MDPLPLSETPRPSQRGGRLRRCLLKGCPRWFRPAHPSGRYCSAACRQAARQWRRWRAQQKYRASAHGRQQRQAQARRYRRRCRRRLAWHRPRTRAADRAATVDPGRPAREGKRWAAKTGALPQRPCDRPGCYVLFPVGDPGDPRRFCCALCRRALRRVLDREARFRQRRRRGLLWPGRHRRPRPRGP